MHAPSVFARVTRSVVVVIVAAEFYCNQVIQSTADYDVCAKKIEPFQGLLFFGCLVGEGVAWTQMGIIMDKGGELLSIPENPATFKKPLV